MPRISWDLRPILPQPLLSITSPQDFEREQGQKVFFWGCGLLCWIEQCENFFDLGWRENKLTSKEDIYHFLAAQHLSTQSIWRKPEPSTMEVFFQWQQNWQKWPNRIIPLGGAFLSFLRPVFQCSYHFHMLLKILPINSILLMITEYAVNCWTPETPNGSTSFLFCSHHGAYPDSPLQWYKVANPRTNILSKIEILSSIANLF